mmetsp:Transcript_3986/g.4517  ORF Transcript_3986/g.4517 Transcript_3986/m.4517 type:complete len:240 (+) Transcript_3986:1173-1892(+)
MSNTVVHLPVARHTGLLLLNLLLAGSREVNLSHVLLEAPEHTALTSLGTLAVNSHFLRAGLETRAQLDVLGLNDVKLGLRLGAAWGEFLCVLNKAGMDAATARLDITAELGHIFSTGLLQDGISPPVLAFGNLDAEQLGGTGCVGDVLTVFLEAVNDGTTASLTLEGAAHLGAKQINFGITGLVEAVVQPVVLSLANLVTLDLGLALRAHIGILVVLLKAADDASMSVGDILAESCDLL